MDIYVKQTFRENLLEMVGQEYDQLATQPLKERIKNESERKHSLRKYFLASLFGGQVRLGMRKIYIQEP